MTTSALASSVRGEVFTPGDAGYAAATATWELSTPSRPPLVLVAASVDDVAAGARWADDNGYGIAILNTGHGAFSSHEDALVISVAGLTAVRVDGATATVGPGARWSDVSAVAAPRGMAGASGGSPGVGVVGYTLGGGSGPLGRTLGFASDRVRSLTVLDAHCRPVRLGPGDGELFWALRGAGGIGVVTELEFDLGVVPTFYGGGVYFDGDDAATILTAYAEWTPSLDDRTTTSIALLHLPPVPQLPEQLRGRFVAHVRFAHVDADASDVAADARAILAKMLAAAPVIVDATRVMAPADLPDIHRDPVAPQAVASRGGFIDRLDPATIGAIVASMAPGAAEAPRMVEVRHLGGAYARSPMAPSSTTGRDAAFNLYVTAPSEPGTDDAAQAIVDGAVARISSSRAGQFNFYGPSPEPGSILSLWDDADAERILSAARMLDPRGRIRTGRPIR